MAVEVNITSPTSAQPVNFNGVNVFNVGGFCRAPGAQPTVDVWLLNGSNTDKFRAANVNIVAVGGAPGFYSWSASFNVTSSFNTSGNSFNCVKVILSTQHGGGGDFITRTAEVFFTAGGFSGARKKRGGNARRTRKP
jgi:hypothetical protein